MYATFCFTTFLRNDDGLFLTSLDALFFYFSFLGNLETDEKGTFLVAEDTQQFGSVSNFYSFETLGKRLSSQM